MVRGLDSSLAVADRNDRIHNLNLPVETICSRLNIFRTTGAGVSRTEGGEGTKRFTL